MHNKARVEGCIAEAFTCKEITNFSSKYLSHTNIVNAHMTWYHIVEEVPLSELSIFQWKGKGVGTPSDKLSHGRRVELYHVLHVHEHGGSPTIF
jgi:hypothetical protein